ncbi:hypothetical protein KAU15_06345, partial [candidate division WOR-3 bacterium]|nr:hypothetical protein [candidate division WOR-3 bacterium]
DDKYFDYDDLSYTSVISGVRDFPEMGIGDEVNYANYYSLQKDSILGNIIYGPYNFEDEFVNIGDKILRKMYQKENYSQIRIIRKDRTHQFTLQSISDLLIDSVEFKGFNNGIDNSPLLFEFYNDNNCNSYNIDSDYLTEPLILLNYYKKYIPIDSEYEVNRIPDSRLPISLYLNTDSVLGCDSAKIQLKITIPNDPLSPRYIDSICMDFSDFLIECEMSINGSYTYSYNPTETGFINIEVELLSFSDGTDSLIIDWSFFNLHFSKFVSLSVIGDINDKFDISEDSHTILSNYDSIIAEIAYSSKDSILSHEKFGFIPTRRISIDGTSYLNIRKCIKKNLVSNIPNFYSMKLFEKYDHMYEYISLMPVSVGWNNYFLVSDRVFKVKEFSYQMCKGQEDSFILEDLEEWRPNNDIYVNIKFDGEYSQSEQNGLPYSFTDYPIYNDELFKITLSTDLENQNIFTKVLYKDDLYNLFLFKNQENQNIEFESNPYLNISEWNTNLYYPNGEVNKDLMPIESISGLFNMNATDWFTPKLQLRAKPKGFVPVNLDMTREWNEDSLENKYFKFYFRDRNGVYQLTNDY